ncbi:amino acid/amide ABC transporter substrate-binding protein (HAAT family) [Yoonia maricola]|uniref:Amino acid/amide ABC transporter substrate-binding protein (HAAT family) n=1 Tax=Yoonia maricola TaxID=420999 RepID=A0A2M8W333_9RHOB|nr:penicillin-binding protein activator [Yoonia maricola]PJI85309.1 amino acid/amide ABC transporter substrate-binding protein (HAAT family) [Yoonia maricola]
MFACFSNARKPLAPFFAFTALLWLAACTVPLAPDANVGDQIDPTEPIEVALLVPGGSAQANDNQLAQNFENAARLAIADLDGVTINLRVYNTVGGNPQQAAAVATQAVNEGAKIIIGPLFGEAANAAGVAVAGRNVNVLAFTNNRAFAGGNVFILGSTFDNTAERLVRFGARQGVNRYVVVHADNLSGRVGRDAITSAVQGNGGEVAAVESYPASQQGIFSATNRILSSVRNSGAQAVFTTASANADLPIIATALPDAGMDINRSRFVGLTRWDALPQIAALPGLDGGLFALPDPGTSALFANRYAATYGGAPHPLAGLAYDAIAAIGALAASGNTQALTKSALTQPEGFRGTSGVFRLLPNGLNQRALAVATIQNKQVVILEQAPRSFGGPGL